MRRFAPLHTVEQLLQWSPDSVHSEEKCTVPLNTGTHMLDRPMILACHDMAGGYHEDAHLFGDGQGMHTSGPAYRHCHWQATDILCYFSHALVTLPPPGWTAAAHRNNTMVLGTFITEWEAGAALCQENLFPTESRARYVAQQLAAIAACYGFEGWLINIENTLPPIENTLSPSEKGKERGEAGVIGNVLVFLRELTRCMQQQRSDALVLWYDAVTVEGKLDWQNTLTESNIPFFNACSGIFINYTWSMDHLANAAAAAAACTLESNPADATNTHATAATGAATISHGSPHVPAAAAAGSDRRACVFMGVDVHGRGTYGGGGFDTWVAVEAARRFGLSSAVFGHAWTWEGAGAEPCTHDAEPCTHDAEPCTEAHDECAGVVHHQHALAQWCFPHPHMLGDDSVAAQHTAWPKEYWFQHRDQQLWTNVLTALTMTDNTPLTMTDNTPLTMTDTQSTSSPPPPPPAASTKTKPIPLRPQCTSWPVLSSFNQGCSTHGQHGVHPIFDLGQHELQPVLQVADALLVGCGDNGEGAVGNRTTAAGNDVGSAQPSSPAIAGHHDVVSLSNDPTNMHSSLSRIHAWAHSLQALLKHHVPPACVLQPCVRHPTPPHSHPTAQHSHPTPPHSRPSTPHTSTPGVSWLRARVRTDMGYLSAQTTPLPTQQPQHLPAHTCLACLHIKGYLRANQRAIVPLFATHVHAGGGACMLRVCVVGKHMLSQCHMSQHGVQVNRVTVRVALIPAEGPGGPGDGTQSGGVVHCCRYCGGHGEEVGEKPDKGGWWVCEEEYVEWPGGALIGVGLTVDCECDCEVNMVIGHILVEPAIC